VEGAGASGVAAPQPRHWDAPLPLLTALSLYGCALGMRGEGEAEGAAMAPSERLRVWVAMCREVRRLRAELGLGGAAVGGGGGGGAELDQGLPLPPAAAPALAPGVAPAYTLAELEEALALLARTFQQPTRARTGIADTLPDFRYSLAPARDCLATGVKEAAIDLRKSPALPRALGAPEETSLWGVPKPVPGVLEALPSERAWLSADEARRALLQSRAVCLWGECNRNKAEYKGALFN